MTPALSLALALTAALAQASSPDQPLSLDRMLIRRSGMTDPGVDPLLHPPTERIGGLSFDFSAFESLSEPPGCDGRAFAKRVAEAAGGASPSRRKYRFGDRPGHAYPWGYYTSVHEYLGRVPVTIVVLPGADAAVTRPAPGGANHAVFFLAGPRSGIPLNPPAAPITTGVAAGLYPGNETPLQFGRIIEQTRDEVRTNTFQLAPLKLGEAGGAELLGYLEVNRVAEDNPRLLRVRLEEPGKPAQEWQTFAVADASGFNRIWSKPGATPGLGPFSIPADKAGATHPLGKHRLWRVPYPTPDSWPYTGGEAFTLDRAELEREPVWILASRREPAEPLIARYALVPAGDWDPDRHGEVEVIAVRACANAAAVATVIRQVAEAQPGDAAAGQTDGR